MIETQSHRAPDEDGFYLDKNISLGMGRLKIIDLKSKNLVPFFDDNFVLLFNGEIYNYIELRQELKNMVLNFAQIQTLKYCLMPGKNGEKMYLKN